MKFDLEHYSSKLVGSKDERAVSPVIGVILMVAITVILAAVIAAFVLDIGDLDDSAPNAQFDWETDSANNNVTVTMTSGDDINMDNLNFESDGSHTISGPSDTFTAGEEVTFEFSSGVSGTAQIIWEADGSSTILDDYDYDTN